MVDLFRYIEQSFVVPPAKDNAIDVTDNTEFQDQFTTALRQNKSNAEIATLAADFIAANTPGAAAEIDTMQPYLVMHEQILSLANPSMADAERIVENVFDASPADLASSAAFTTQKRLLNDLLLAVKITTGFNKVATSNLVKTRQAIALVETLQQNDQRRQTTIKTLLQRPVLVPAAFLKKQAVAAGQPFVPPPPPADDLQKKAALQKQFDAWQNAYITMMALRPDELKVEDLATAKKKELLLPKQQEAALASPKFLPVPAQQVLTLSNKAFAKLDPMVIQSFETEFGNYKITDQSTLIGSVRAKLKDITALLDPCEHIKATTKVYRVGINAFAVRATDPVPAQPGAPVVPGAPPDFSHAITRPVGLGNLQVVRQQLIGYEVSEVSHIENILQGEILRHSTVRKDSNELTLTDITQTTQFDERDLQSTVRNEMSSESQKEASQQNTSAADQTTTATYGKLVENNKSNYAKTVTDRAVSSLSQQVTTQRVQREKKSFTEKSFHEFDNSKSGAKNVTGIYQWVDKKYNTKVVNYGARMLYDVVVPEPAAFLISSLKNAPQPEGQELIKPDVFDICPSCVTPLNYACLAAKYGVSGAVTPPPEEFKYTQHKDSSMTGPATVTGFIKENAVGPNDKVNTVNGFFFKDAVITIPQDYEALTGYIMMLLPNSSDNHEFEFFIGEHHVWNPASFKVKLFPMSSETGEIPVLFRSFFGIYQYGYSIWMQCRRTDRALEVWQLKMHAIIMNGYNRQLADYQERLAKFQANIRAQMANAVNYAHNPSIEKGELKKAFIYLLLSEHFNYAYRPTPNPEVIPTDPVYMKKWGAMVAFFERAFEWENIMYTYYPYYWGRRAVWGDLVLIQDISPQFEEFLKAGAARVVIPVRPGFEGALAHYHETGDIWMGEEMPNMFSELYVSIIQEIKARNFAPEDEIVVDEWEVKLPTTLVMLKKDAVLP